MAISLTTLNGTDSIASSRITINDNFSTISSALNSVLSVVDIATGLFDNTGYGSNNNIRTETVTATNGISISSGNLNLSNGNIIVSGSVQLGSGTNVSISKTLHSLTVGNIYCVNMAGATAITGTTPVGALIIPRLTTSEYQSIRNPHLGSIVYDTITTDLMICTSTSAVSGATGIWSIVGLQN